MEDKTTPKPYGQFAIKLGHLARTARCPERGLTYSVVPTTDKQTLAPHTPTRGLLDGYDVLGLIQVCVEHHYPRPDEFKLHHEGLAYEAVHLLLRSKKDGRYASASTCGPIALHQPLVAEALGLDGPRSGD